MLGAVGPRAAAAPVALSLEIDGSRLSSSRRQGTSLRDLLRFHGTCHVELDKLPKLNEEIERKSPKRLLVEFDAFENDCFKIHFSTNQMHMKLNDKKRIPVKTGPKVIP